MKFAKDLKEDVQGNKKLLYNLAKSYRKAATILEQQSVTKMVTFCHTSPHILPHITKIYDRILERRLRRHVEEKLGEWQHGFRPNRSISDVIFSMKMILEMTWEFNDKTYLAFLDLEETGYRDRNYGK